MWTTWNVPPSLWTTSDASFLPYFDSSMGDIGLDVWASGSSFLQAMTFKFLSCCSKWRYIFWDFFPLCDELANGFEVFSALQEDIYFQREIRQFKRTIFVEGYSALKSD
mmetsp:Transcript_7733/g.11266  ORF Transcript_7733/g.11266 Transcript_7733/m.11266 type:complete len:109 (-) Transcript_7733:127-453(-)